MTYLTLWMVRNDTPHYLWHHLMTIKPSYIMVDCEVSDEREEKGMMNYKEMVYETSVKEIEKLNNLTDEEIKRNPHLLKVSQLKNSHVLSIIKQQEIDYKMSDLDLRTTMYDLRNERNNIMKDNIKLQEQKLK